MPEIEPSSSEPGSAAAKPELRERLRARLATLGPEARKAAEPRIVRRVLELPEVRRARAVLSCLSFGGEPNTWRLVEEITERGIALYVPRAEGSDHSLHVHPWPCRLETLSFGLRQPAKGEPELAPDEIAERLDAVLVLGLGFDPTHGWRLGHGAGYFDRFFAAQPDPLRIALAFESQIENDLPAEPHDLPMDVVVTEDRVLRFER